VGQGEKYDLSLFGEKFGFGLGEAQGLRSGMIGKLREDLSYSLTGVLARRDDRKFGVRVGEQQADEFLAGITGGADDSDFAGCHEIELQVVTIAQTVRYLSGCDYFTKKTRWSEPAGREKFQLN